MYRLYGFILGIAVLIGASFLTHGDELKRDGRRAVLKELFNVVDLSEHDLKVDSVLDTEHISSEELELLKAQAMQEAMEESILDISAAEDGISPLPSLRAGKDIPQKSKKSFDEKLKELELEDKLKNEFEAFATTVQGLMSKALKNFEDFRKSEEVKELQKEAEETATKAGNEIQAAVEGFVKSKEFKDLQNTAAGILNRLNTQINAFFKDKSAQKKEEKNKSKKKKN